jgi:hypothetical protein
VQPMNFFQALEIAVLCAVTHRTINAVHESLGHFVQHTNNTNDVNGISNAM